MKDFFITLFAMYRRLRECGYGRLRALRTAIDFSLPL